MSALFMNCGKDHCGACCGVLALSERELAQLRMFAQVPFLSVSRRGDTGISVLLGDGADELDAFGFAVIGLQQKRLIQLDYDIPLKNFGYEKYRQFPCCGSMALTAKGQAVAERLEM